MTNREVEEWFKKCEYTRVLMSNGPLMSHLGDSVQWHRARALVARWDEEVEILVAEFLRVIDGFERMSRAWSELALDFEPSRHRAYGLEKSLAYSRMVKNCRALYEAAGGTYPREGESLFDLIWRIRRERPRLEPTSGTHYCTYHYYRPFGDENL